MTPKSSKDGPSLAAQIRDICAGTIRLAEELRSIGPDELWDRIDGKIFDWGRDYADGYSREDVAKRHKAYLAGVARKKLEDRFTVSLFSHVEK